VKSQNLALAAEYAKRMRENQGRKHFFEVEEFEGSAERPIWILDDERLLEETSIK
jgi:hypothetical protein